MENLTFNFRNIKNLINFLYDLTINCQLSILIIIKITCIYFLQKIKYFCLLHKIQMNFGKNLINLMKGYFSPSLIYPLKYIMLYFYYIFATTCVHFYIYSGRFFTRTVDKDRIANSYTHVELIDYYDFAMKRGAI